jgi:integrase/recombinase XerD
VNKHHPNNERIKRQYLFFLKEAKGRSVDSVDAAAAALARYEEYTGYRDFKTFRPKQATSFKDHLAKQISRKTGEKLSKATLNSTLAQLKQYFEWLSDKPGYKSRIAYADASFFNLSAKEVRMANARHARPVPTLQQMLHTIATMPNTTDIQRRDKAVIAYTLLTGSRVMATASMKLKHIDVVAGRVLQDGGDGVKTKFSKTFVSDFLPVGDEITQIVVDWVNYLQHELLWGNDDPLFPSTRMELNSALQFQAVGLERKHWSTATPIRKIFRMAFEGAGLPYFNPHSVRFTVARLGQKLCHSVEAMKAWSQSMGHEHVLTTLLNYGEVSEERQGEIIRGLGAMIREPNSRVEELARELAREALRLGGAPKDDVDS